MATVAAREREERVKREFEAWQLKLLRDKEFDAVVSLVQARKALLELPDPDFAWTPLLFAADGGALQLINALLDAKAKLEVQDVECNGCLGVAARQGHIEAVQLLAARQANLDAQNRGGWTPLIWAAINGHDRAAAALLDLRASFYVVDALGRTALMWAARHGHTVVAEALLSRGVDFTRRDEDGLNAADHAQEHFELRASIVLAEERSRRLHEAAQRNDVEAARQAIEAGAGADIPDDTGWSPLAWAMLMESRSLVEVLVQHGANPHLLGEEVQIAEQLTTKHTPVSEVLKHVLEANGVLLRAARTGYYTCAERQLRLGAWINAQDQEERTPLMWAARRGSVKGTNLFIGKGALINARDRIGFTAFLYSVLSGNIEVPSILYHHSADINARSYFGHSAVHLAVRAEDAKMVQVLLAAGLDANEQDYCKRAPVHAAAANGQLAVLYALVFCQADLHARDHAMRTPLLMAAAEEQLTICEALLGSHAIDPLEPTPDPYEEVHEEGEEPPPVEEDDGLSEASGGSQSSRAGKSRKSTRGGKRGKSGRKGSKTGRKGSKESKAPPQDKERFPPRAMPPPEPPLAEDLGDEFEGLSEEERRQAEEEARRKLAQNRLRKVSVAVGTATGLKVAVERKSPTAKAKASPSAKRRVALLAKFDGPLGLVRAAAEWRSERLAAKDRPKMPEPEELYVDEDIDGRRPLQLAAQVPSKSICALLLEKYADVRASDKSKTDALIDAARTGDAEVVELLLAHEGDFQHRNTEGERAVDVAASAEARQVLDKAAVQKRVPKRLVGRKSAAEDKEKPQPPPVEAPKPAIFRARLERLPRRIESELLRMHIRRLLRDLGAGRPISLEVMLDPITERPKGVAFADFAEERALEAALTGNGEDFLDREIAILRDLPMAMVR